MSSTDVKYYNGLNNIKIRDCKYVEQNVSSFWTLLFFIWILYIVELVLILNIADEILLAGH
jgi:hypothetical protein